MQRDRIQILRVPVDNLTQEETIGHIAQFISAGGSHQIVTVNPEFVVAAQKNEEFRRVLKEADLCLPDGVGLLWASRVLGTPLHQRVTGTDTVHSIARVAAERGWRLFLLGGKEGVAAEGARKLQSQNPGLFIAGTYAGSPAREEEDKILDLVREAKPHILLVAYGVPQQDLWIYRNREKLGVAVAMGVGGAFDFIAGSVPRAPGWMQRIGLEWLFRLLVEPWRWRRMLALPYFVWLILRNRRG
ncbi:MAG: WecB/TagA/CpsF family glycosyltransferase [Chloroflexi bacterium]|nr:WecB/TagA/CpsF family glycosyltransferase [Chloroflexota bacterium]